MTVTREVKMEVQRLAQAEGWAVGTIAISMGITLWSSAFSTPSKSEAA